MESENTESWWYFLSQLKLVIPQVLDAALASDQEEDLQQEKDVLGNNIVWLHFLEHLHQNFICRRTQKHENLFWKIANASTQADFDSAVDLLRREQPTAATYLLNIPLSAWVSAFIPSDPACRFGERTSIPVEAINSILRKAQEISVLDLLSKIWHYTMEARDKQLQITLLVPVGQIFTPYCQNILVRKRQNAGRYLVRLSDQWNGIITCPGHERLQFAVDLERCTCTCHDFQNFNIPCQHYCLYLCAQISFRYIYSSRIPSGNLEKQIHLQFASSSFGNRYNG